LVKQEMNEYFLGRAPHAHDTRRGVSGEGRSKKRDKVKPRRAEDQRKRGFGKRGSHWEVLGKGPSWKGRRGTAVAEKKQKEEKMASHGNSGSMSAKGRTNRSFVEEATGVKERCVCQTRTRLGCRNPDGKLVRQNRVVHEI